MSKWPKALDPEKNDLFRWRIFSIQNSNKSKTKSDDDGSSDRAKIFNIQDPAGNIFFKIKVLMKNSKIDFESGRQKWTGRTDDG